MHQENFNILTKINTIDYLQKWGDQYSSFDVELSFTWLDWRILELMIQDDKFNIENVEIEQKIQLPFNIWPSGRGILHHLALGGESKDKDKNM